VEKVEEEGEEKRREERHQKMKLHTATILSARSPSSIQINGPKVFT